MRYIVLLGALAFAGCSASLGGGGGHDVGKAPPSSAPVAPMQSGIPESPHVMADITNVQQKLTETGLYHGPIDGRWGPKTAAAMRAYQQANGLPVTGVADHASLVKMDLAQPE